MHRGRRMRVARMVMVVVDGGGGRGRSCRCYNITYRRFPERLNHSYCGEIPGHGRPNMTLPRGRRAAIVAWHRGIGCPAWAGRRDGRTENPRGRDRRGDDRNGPRQRRPFRHGVRRRHLQHRGLSRARRHRRVLRDRARRRSLLRQHGRDGGGRGREDRPDAARAGPPARPLHHRDRRQGRAPLPLLARRGAGARAVRASGLESDRREHDGRAS